MNNIQKMEIFHSNFYLKEGMILNMGKNIIISIAIFFIVNTFYIFYYKVDAQNATTIEGYAFETYSNDKLDEEDLGSSPIFNITVNLLDSNTNILKTTLTDQNGKYSFSDVENGKYKIQFIWGKLDEEAINNANTSEQIKALQNILKYNGQDYNIDYSNGSFEIVEDEERRLELDEYFETFDYGNTVIFRSIDMNISNQDDISRFKEYAKTLTANSYMIGTSANTITVNNSQNITGPTLNLIEREPFEISPSSTVTAMDVTLSNGTIINNPTTTEEEQNYLIATVQENQLYGTSIRLEYTISFENTSAYSSCSSLGFAIYLPKNFTYKDQYGISAIGINSNNEEKNLNVEEITLYNSQNVDDFETSSEELINYIKENSLLYIKLSINNNDFSFDTNEKIKVKVSVGTLLSGNEEDMSYPCNVEIVDYDNEFIRRMNYSGQNLDTSTAIAGNHDQLESDYNQSLNCGIILFPTGHSSRKDILEFFIAIWGILLLTIVYKNKLLK